MSLEYDLWPPGAHKMGIPQNGMVSKNGLKIG